MISDSPLISVMRLHNCHCQSFHSALVMWGYKRLQNARDRALLLKLTNGRMAVMAGFSGWLKINGCVSGECFCAALGRPACVTTDILPGGSASSLGGFSSSMSKSSVGMKQCFLMRIKFCYSTTAYFPLCQENIACFLKNLYFFKLLLLLKIIHTRSSAWL